MARGIISGLKKCTIKRHNKTPRFKLRIYGVELFPMPKYYIDRRILWINYYC